MLSQPQLLLCTVLVVAALIVAVTRLRMPAFIALLLASLAVGICAGMNVSQIITAFQQGVGSILGSIAFILGLGAIFGKLMAESGGARLVAERLVQLSGERYLPWTMAVLGFLVGPVFFSLGRVLLVPVLCAVRERTSLPFLHLAVPMLMGLSASHGLVPPHPGPMVAIELLKADVGRTLVYSLVIGTGAFVISGPLLCRICPWWKGVEPSGSLKEQFVIQDKAGIPPRFGPTLLTMLLPVLLMLSATAADLLLPSGHWLRKMTNAFGTPLGAMLVTVLVSYRVLGTSCGFNRQMLLKFTEECLAPIAGVLLVIGAGGGFSKVLASSGVGDAIAEFARSAPVSPLVYGWLIAAVIRVATGSATVAIVTTAGFVAPAAAAAPGVNYELLVIAMGAGSLILSHVNDGGFWLVKEYLGLSLSETFKSWTLAETVLSITGLLLTLLFDILIR